MFLGTALTGTIGYLSPRFMLPDGLRILAAVMAWTRSSGESPYARRRSGLALMTMVRALPPKGGGAETPGRVAKSGRTRLRAASCIWPTVTVGSSVEKTR